MVDRRNVLKLGAAGMAGMLVHLPGRGLGAAVLGDFRHSLARAVFDERFDECLAFADELGRRGVVTSGIRGDVATLWYGDLRVRATRSPAPIAGLTDRVALFCLEELARDVGMKVCFRVDHLIEANGHVRHEAAGPTWIVDAARTLAPESGFGRAMAVLASHVPVSQPGEITAQKRTGPFSPGNRTALVSWVIA